jgi:hypothetical protein
MYSQVLHTDSANYMCVGGLRCFGWRIKEALSVAINMRVGLDFGFVDRVGTPPRVDQVNNEIDSDFGFKTIFRRFLGFLSRKLILDLFLVFVRKVY